MKTLILLSLFTSVSVAASAQLQKVYDTKEVTWLGIDFSNARFIGVTEPAETIINQNLEEINKLVLNEPGKYDIMKYFDKNVVDYDLSMVNELNSEINPDELIINGTYDLSIDNINAIVKEYDTPKSEGLGLVFIAVNLDKPGKSGAYYVTFFDMATKEVVYTSRMKGANGGFGFRNYWASTVYNVMKQWKKQNKK